MSQEPLFSADASLTASKSTAATAAPVSPPAPVTLAATERHAPPSPSRRRWLQAGASAAAATGLGAAASASAATPAQRAADRAPARSLQAQLERHIQHVVVIYLENRSFANLYANFPGTLDPLTSLPPERAVQRDRNGQPLPSLPKVWGGLVPRSQSVDGKTYRIAEHQITGLPNAPFVLKDAEGQVLPESVITRDLWHLFYQNQMQINGGRNDQFAAWADAGGLVMGHYGESAQQLGLWKLAQQYTLCDRFFMAAFGGSYLNHQFLISGRTPEYFNARDTAARTRIAVTEDGPQGSRLALAPDNPASALDGPPKFVRDGAITPDGYAVNTMAPPYQPSYVRPAAGGDPLLADPAHASVLPPQTYDTIGDLLSRKGVSWAWYGGAWQAALERRSDGDRPNFQYHHQPFNYFRQFAPGSAERAVHLRDGGTGDSPMSNHFLADIVAGRLPAVTFYKPQGNLNLHAGYSDVASGDQHVANVIEYLKRSPQWPHTLVVVTFDENGGWWDPVAPPVGDRWGPGSRVPALLISPHVKKGHVDHTFYDTTSILRFITRLHGLPLLEGLAVRDAAFRARGERPPGDLSAAFSFA